MKKILFAVSALGFLILLAGCGYQTQTQPKQTKSPAPVENKVSANSVTIQNFAFSPAELKIKVGTTVTWTNNDSVSHSIKSAAFNSAVLANGDSFQFKLDKAGIYDYQCGIHPSMQGKIIVE
ncbi:MAG: hypothetical protein A3J63_01910 [Candidatus Moranbacteria bacterium RIFCSPHIGHO2_02_FULL_40_12b]|nr:MAG: hypothetical protein A3J63_01910 [Candidatus Moranbacteria bacterium RIFCSPHIGHO2_02_FULL_40_12b]OGI23385.1 MAG: hypothetical protein A3E91_02415 [Candidatus Moranbacteria bacterium RIFCSPHIGHO2_12_FULL_40_10]